MSEKEKKEYSADTVSERLIKARKELKLSQEEVAETIGVDRGTYSRYEKGYPIRSHILFKISDCLGVSADYLLGLDNHLNKGNEEFMEFTGLDEVAVETLRALKDMDTMISDAHDYSISRGKYKTALSKGFITVLNTLLSNPDTFATLATAFINYSDNSFIHPVHSIHYKDSDVWVPLKEEEFGLATDKSPDDNVTVRFNAYTTKAIHKNTLDILISEYAKAYHKATTQRVPSLRSPQGRGGSNP